MTDNIKLVEQLKKNFSKLMEVNDKILDQLPQECEEQKNQIKKDILEITKAVQEGDLSKLNLIKEKYANRSTK